MKKLAVLLAGALLMFTTGLAHATYVTLSTSQLLSAGQVQTNSNAPALVPPVLVGGAVEFSASMFDLAPANPVYSYIGVNAASYGLTDLTGYDTFQLSIANTNNSNWDLALFMQANGSTYLSPFLQVAPTGNFLNFSYNLTSLGANISDVEYLGFAVQSNLTGSPAYTVEPSNPDYYHVTVAPVPEPGTMLLLGAGFLGLAIYGKRRKNA